MKKSAIIVLAAGGSIRLGQPKQLLTYHNETLLQRIVGCILQVKDVIPAVVVGSNKELMHDELRAYDVEIIENDDWASGMSTSIAKGLSSSLQKHPDIEGCMFVVCDQPYLTIKVIQGLLDSVAQSGKGIAAARYGLVIGTPVFFNKKYFKELVLLKADEGAKRLIKKYPDDVITIHFPQGAIDIDTMEDYNKLTDAGG